LKSLLVKNNTQENNIDLLSNKNTFYFEYLNNPNVYYLDNTNLQSYLGFNISIYCRDQEIFDYNYTITLGDIKQDQININITEFLNEHLNYTKFDYFIEKKGLTVSLPTDVYLKFKLFDMKSILPLVTLYYPLAENFSNQNNITIKKHFVKKLDSKNNGYDLFIMNSDTIRNFICEDFECDKDQEIEEILVKNYKNKNFYINFSSNLMSYIKGKNYKTQSDWGLSDSILKDGLKFTKIEGAQSSKKVNENDKEIITKFLSGIERYYILILF